MNIDKISKDSVAKLQEMIAGSNKIAVVSHKKPDGDAIGSSLAMYFFLKENLAKEVAVFYPDPIAPTLSFMAGSAVREHIFSYEHNSDAITSYLQTTDLVICLDFNNLSRIDSLGDAIAACPAPKILIDHHENPDHQPFALVFSEPEASSASEYLYHILRETSWINHDSMNLPLASRISLYIGMTTDTNNFANSTSKSTFEMAGDLAECGVDRDVIIDRLFKNYPERRYRFLGHLLAENLVISDKGVAVMYCTKEMLAEYGILEGETEGFVNVPLEIDRVRISVFLKEDKDCFRASLRAIKPQEVHILAHDYFQGGGHKQASGGRIAKMSREDAIKYVFENAEKYII